MKVLYKANAVSVGGRDGKVHVENTPIHFEMALPSEMGGTKGVGFNPEQLFAAGYAACFGSALQHVFRTHKLSLSAPEVHVTAGIGAKDGGGFQLAVDILAVFKGVEQDAADKLVQEAHLVCPYSNATRGNIEVNVSARAE
jgi:lipoyl-dependent peroxiredoxin